VVLVVVAEAGDVERATARVPAAYGKSRRTAKRIWSWCPLAIEYSNFEIDWLLLNGWKTRSGTDW
jgi:hypothetical protein